MNKTLLTTGLIAGFIVALFVGFIGGSHPPLPAAESALTTTTTSVTASSTTSSTFLTAPAPTSHPPVQAASSSAPVPADNITLKVVGTAYGAYISGNESVLDLMRSVASTGNFVFAGEDYPSLGFFVDSINGTKNGNGLYWILYVNGKSSDLGASNEIIKPGDTVEWRFEKGN